MENPTIVNFKDIARKDEMSFTEALSVLKHYDAKIKNAAKSRSEKPRMSRALSELELNGEAMIGGGAFLFVLNIPIVIVISLILEGLVHWLFPAARSIVDIFAYWAIPVVGTIAVGLFITGIVLFNHRHLSKLFRTKSHKKAQYELFITTQLHEINEEEYSAKLSKILSKTQKALDVVNENLVDEKIICKSDLGKEGFVSVDVELGEMTLWETLNLKYVK